MKNVFLKYMSALLAVWYCLSIIGFDVHSCETTGDTFVASVLNGTTCDDIHPEHDCDRHGSCCHSHEDQDDDNIEDDGCCKNEIEVLECDVLTCAGDDDFIQLGEAVACLFVESDYTTLLNGDVVSYVSYCPDSGDLLQSDSQAVLSIWRI